MNELEIKELIARGEGYHLEFKEENASNEKFAKALVCFANTDGGKILVGIDDNGNTKGVSGDIDEIEQSGNLFKSNRGLKNPGTLH